MFQVFVSFLLLLLEPLPEPLPVPVEMPFIGVCAFPLRQTFVKCPRFPHDLQVSSLYQQSFL